MTNKSQHHESRKRDEGHHAKHMRADGSVPIMGAKGMAIHGKTTGEMADCKTGMCTDKGMGRMMHGKTGDHEENS